MIQVKKPIGRPPAQQNMLLRHLRTQIVTGDLPPGSRVPTRDELERRFGVSRGTTQRVFEALVRERFVESRGALGTFVSANPPHLCDYGLVFISRQGANDWRRFDTALLNEASTINEGRARKIHFYHNIVEHPDSQVERDRLLADTQAHKLAGIIFASNPPLEMRPVFLQPALPVPVVAIMSQPDLPGVTSVTLNSESFIAKALDYLISRGRRRIACLNISGSLPTILNWQKRLLAIIAQHGMTTESYWMLAMGSEAAAAASVSKIVHLLFEPGKPNRPDCLFITDDNLVEYATAGLVAAGVRVPDDVDVVAHCNFPWPVPSAIPIKRLGYNVQEVLRQCISIIDMQRQGQTPPKQVLVEAVFEEELAAAVSAQLVAS